MAVDLVGLTEIAAMLGVSRARAHQLAESDGFPVPVSEIAAGRIWRREDVERWARETGRLE
ncbi:MAG: DNA-binding protein [Actinomycetota bacterium]|nr:DNA-binding protein [Actinomycetota bacterium]